MSSAIARREPFLPIPRDIQPPPGYVGSLEATVLRPPLTIECRPCGQDLALILDDWGYWRYSHPWGPCRGRRSTESAAEPADSGGK